MSGTKLVNSVVRALAREFRPQRVNVVPGPKSGRNRTPVYLVSRVTGERIGDPLYVSWAPRTDEGNQINFARQAARRIMKENGYGK